MARSPSDPEDSEPDAAIPFLGRNASASPLDDRHFVAYTGGEVFDGAFNLIGLIHGLAIQNPKEMMNTINGVRNSDCPVVFEFEWELAKTGLRVPIGACLIICVCWGYVYVSLNSLSVRVLYNVPCPVSLPHDPKSVAAPVVSHCLTLPKSVAAPVVSRCLLFCFRNV